MAINIKGKDYVAPGEKGTPQLTGDELMAIEDHFELDGLRLFAALENPDKALKGYTLAKALYSLAWVCRVRAGEIVSIADVLKDTSAGEIILVEGDDEDPKEVATETEYIKTLP